MILILYSRLVIKRKLAVDDVLIICGAVYLHDSFEVLGEWWMTDGSRCAPWVER